jgi:hypothetical protein
MKILVPILLFTATVLSAQTERMVLLETFTNSHCGPCASMYSAISSQVYATPRTDNVVPIFYHAPTYLDDPLYQYNTSAWSQRAQHLGGVSGTPTVFVGGLRFAGSYSTLGARVDEQIAMMPQYVVTIGTRVEDGMLKADVVVRRDGSASQAVTLYAAVVENVMYRGRNGVADHRNVFRKGFTPAGGRVLSFDAQGMATVALEMPWDQVWVADEVRVVAAVQSSATADVFEAAQAPVSMTTSVQNEGRTDLGIADRIDVYGLQGQLVTSLIGQQQTERALESLRDRLPYGGLYLIVRTVHGRRSAEMRIIDR